MKYLLVGLIKIYQVLPLSSHSACRFSPTCSEYAIEAIKEWGAFKGTKLAIKRLLRCNPTSKIGYDPVPKKG